MVSKLDRGTNGVYSLHCHFIICIKYRRKAFVRDDIVADLKAIVEQVASEYNVAIIEQECGEDHLHILFKCKPTLIMKDFIQAVKGRSARALRSKYEDYLKPLLWGKHFLVPFIFLSYYG